MGSVRIISRRCPRCGRESACREPAGGTAADFERLAGLCQRCSSADERARVDAAIHAAAGRDRDPNAEAA